MRVRRRTNTTAASDRRLNAELEKLNQKYAYCRRGEDQRIAVFPSNWDSPDSDPIEFLKVQTFHGELAPKRIGDSQLSRIWWNWPRRHSYAGVIFDPSKRSRGKMLNLWRGFKVRGNPDAGSWKLLRRHLFETVCRRNPYWFAYTVCWMGNIVQGPSAKLGTAIVVKGKKGTGKTKVAEWIKALMPHNASIIAKGDLLLGRFNKHLETNIFTCMEEAFWAGDPKGEAALKDMITGPTQMIEPKGLNAFEAPNHNRLWICSNNDWVVPASGDERRFFVLEISNEHEKDFPWFAAIDAEMKAGGLEAMMFDLKNLPYPCWLELRRPPSTPWLGEQIEQSLSALDAWWLSVLSEGCVTDGGCTYDWDHDSLEITRDAFWHSFQAHRRETKTRGNVTRTQFGTFMTETIGAVVTRPRDDTLEKTRGTANARPRCYRLGSLALAQYDFTERTQIQFKDGEPVYDFSRYELPDDMSEQAVARWTRYGEGASFAECFPDEAVSGEKKFKDEEWLYSEERQQEFEQGADNRSDADSQPAENPS